VTSPAGTQHKLCADDRALPSRFPARWSRCDSCTTTGGGNARRQSATELLFVVDRSAGLALPAFMANVTIPVSVTASGCLELSQGSDRDYLYRLVDQHGIADRVWFFSCSSRGGHSENLLCAPEEALVWHPKQRSRGGDASKDLTWALQWRSADLVRYTWFETDAEAFAVRRGAQSFPACAVCCSDVPTSAGDRLGPMHAWAAFANFCDASAEELPPGSGRSLWQPAADAEGARSFVGWCSVQDAGRLLQVFNWQDGRMYSVSFVAKGGSNSFSQGGPRRGVASLPSGLHKSAVSEQTSTLLTGVQRESTQRLTGSSSSRLYPPMTTMMMEAMPTARAVILALHALPRGLVVALADGRKLVLWHPLNEPYELEELEIQERIVFTDARYPVLVTQRCHRTSRSSPTEHHTIRVYLLQDRTTGDTQNDTTFDSGPVQLALVWEQGLVDPNDTFRAACFAHPWSGAGGRGVHISPLLCLLIGETLRGLELFSTPAQPRLMKSAELVFVQRGVQAMAAVEALRPGMLDLLVLLEGTPKPRLRLQFGAEPVGYLRLLGKTAAPVWLANAVKCRFTLTLADGQQYRVCLSRLLREPLPIMHQLWGACRRTLPAAVSMQIYLAFIEEVWRPQAAETQGTASNELEKQLDAFWRALQQPHRHQWMHQRYPERGTFCSSSSSSCRNAGQRASGGAAPTDASHWRSVPDLSSPKTSILKASARPAPGVLPGWLWDISASAFDEMHSSLVPEREHIATGGASEAIHDSQGQLSLSPLRLATQSAPWTRGSERSCSSAASHRDDERVSTEQRTAKASTATRSDAAKCTLETATTTTAAAAAAAAAAAEAPSTGRAACDARTREQPCSRCYRGTPMQGSSVVTTRRAERVKGCPFCWETGPEPSGTASGECLLRLRCELQYAGAQLPETVPWKSLLVAFHTLYEAFKLDQIYWQALLSVNHFLKKVALAANALRYWEYYQRDMPESCERSSVSSGTLHPASSDESLEASSLLRHSRSLDKASERSSTADPEEARICDHQHNGQGAETSLHLPVDAEVASISDQQSNQQRVESSLYLTDDSEAPLNIFDWLQDRLPLLLGIYKTDSACCRPAKDMLAQFPAAFASTLSTAPSGLSAERHPLDAPLVREFVNDRHPDEFPNPVARLAQLVTFFERLEHCQQSTSSGESTGASTELSPAHAGVGPVGTAALDSTTETIVAEQSAIPEVSVPLQHPCDAGLVSLHQEGIRLDARTLARLPVGIALPLQHALAGLRSEPAPQVHPGAGNSDADSELAAAGVVSSAAAVAGWLPALPEPEMAMLRLQSGLSPTGAGSGSAQGATWFSATRASGAASREALGTNITSRLWLNPSVERFAAQVTSDLYASSAGPGRVAASSFTKSSSNGAAPLRAWMPSSSASALAIAKHPEHHHRRHHHGTDDDDDDDDVEGALFLDDDDIDIDDDDDGIDDDDVDEDGNSVALFRADPGPSRERSFPSAAGTSAATHAIPQRYDYHHHHHDRRCRRRRRRQQGGRGVVHPNHLDGCELTSIIPWLRFRADRRLWQVQRLLRSAVPVLLTDPDPAATAATTETTTLGSSSSSPLLSPSEVQAQLFASAQRTLAAPIGRGAFTAWTGTVDDSTKTLLVPPLVLSGRLPQRSTPIQLDASVLPAAYFEWGAFHNAVAAGLRLRPSSTRFPTWIRGRLVPGAPEASGGSSATRSGVPAQQELAFTAQVPVTRAWIRQQKPSRPTASHAGLVLALGLHGHLRQLQVTDWYAYLLPRHELTSIALLLGLGASYGGTAHALVARLAGLHIRAFNPTGFAQPDWDVSPAVQSAAVLAMGLVFACSGRKAILEGLFVELCDGAGVAMASSIAAAASTGAAAGAAAPATGSLGAGVMAASGGFAGSAAGTSNTNNTSGWPWSVRRDREAHALAAGLALGLVGLPEAASEQRSAATGANVSDMVTGPATAARRYVGSLVALVTRTGAGDADDAPMRLSSAKLPAREERRPVARRERRSGTAGTVHGETNAAPGTHAATANAPVPHDVPGVLASGLTDGALGATTTRLQANVPGGAPTALGNEDDDDYNNGDDDGASYATTRLPTRAGYDSVTGTLGRGARLESRSGLEADDSWSSVRIGAEGETEQGRASSPSLSISSSFSTSSLFRAGITTSSMPAVDSGPQALLDPERIPSDASAAAVGALMALTVWYLRSNDEAMARKLGLPRSGQRALWLLRPELVLLRSLAAALIRWDAMSPSWDWMLSELPAPLAAQWQADRNREAAHRGDQPREENSTLRSQGLATGAGTSRISRWYVAVANDPVVPAETEQIESAARSSADLLGSGAPQRPAVVRLYMLLALTGQALAMALKLAGTAHPQARRILEKLLDLVDFRYTAIANSSAAPWLLACIDNLSIAMAVVCAGHGTHSVYRRLRRLLCRRGATGIVAGLTSTGMAGATRPSTLSRTTSGETYGNHLARHLALGLVFLGGGTVALSSCHRLQTALLLAALYPRYPAAPSDNQYHLQALRHLYVLAAEARCFVTLDADTRTPCPVPVEVMMVSSTSTGTSNTVPVRYRDWTPCLLPALDSWHELVIRSPRYWSVSLSAEALREIEPLANTYLAYVVYVRRHAGHLSYLRDPHGVKGLTCRSLPLRYLAKAPSADWMQLFATDPVLSALFRYGLAFPGSPWSNASNPIPAASDDTVAPNLATEGIHRSPSTEDAFTTSTGEEAWRVCSARTASMGMHASSAHAWPPFGTRVPCVQASTAGNVVGDDQEIAFWRAALDLCLEADCTELWLLLVDALDAVRRGSVLQTACQRHRHRHRHTLWVGDLVLLQHWVGAAASRMPRAQRQTPLQRLERWCCSSVASLGASLEERLSRMVEAGAAGVPDRSLLVKRCRQYVRSGWSLVPEHVLYGHAVCLRWLQAPLRCALLPEYGALCQALRGIGSARGDSSIGSASAMQRRTCRGSDSQRSMPMSDVHMRSMAERASADASWNEWALLVAWLPMLSEPETR